MGYFQKQARVTISVFNNAGVPGDVLAQAEDEGSWIFRRAGIEVKWLDCKVPALTEEASRTCAEAIFPEHLQLRIIRKSATLRAEAMGVAFQTEDGTGCYADLFYVPMQDLQKTEGTNVASLLGHVAAHEIGHLLLGTHSHAAAGIMHAHWTSGELADSKVGMLVFMNQEARQMREKLLGTAHVPGERSAAIAARVGD